MNDRADHTQAPNGWVKIWDDGREQVLNGFLQEYMKNKILEDQGEIVFNPFKFFGGEPLKQREKLEEGTLTEEEIDTGLGVGNAICGGLEQQRMREQLGL